MNQFNFVLAILLCINCFGQTKTTFEPKFKESKKTTHKIKKGQQYTFGYLEVLENRQNPKGGTIKIPVYIFKSRSDNPKPDPVLYTVGGPGYTSMRASQYMNYYRYLDDRDLILFEQRGTQYAKPSLDCPEWSKALSISNHPDFDETKTDSLFQKAARDCKERLEKDGNDLSSYTTNDIAADINDLMSVLEIEEYNLLTMSYSTKIGQVLMRDYPDKIRSVVMDSPLPLEVSFDEESVNNLLETVDKMLVDCESDTDFNMAFPNIKSRFYNYLKDKTNNPLEVKVENTENGELATFYLKVADLINVFSSDRTGDAPNIPFEINKIINNDLTTVKQQIQSLFKKHEDVIVIGMSMLFWCRR